MRVYLLYTSWSIPALLRGAPAHQLGLLCLQPNGRYTLYYWSRCNSPSPPANPPLPLQNFPTLAANVPRSRCECAANVPPLMLQKSLCKCPSAPPAYVLRSRCKCPSSGCKCPPLPLKYTSSHCKYSPLLLLMSPRSRCKCPRSRCKSSSRCKSRSHC